MNSVVRTVRRVRHELKFRLLRVVRVAHVTPRLLCVTLAGDALAGFVSAAHDDHVKVFFPAPGEEKPALPEMGPDGLVFPGGVRPAARDYTPRRFDAATGELDLEFALHGEGPAAEWAAQAKPGHYLGIGGPRGSFVLEGDYDGYLLVGDDTALPAIARRLAELPAGSKACVVADIEDEAEQQRFATRAALEVHWVHRHGAPAGEAARLADAVAALPPFEGDWYAWVAAESQAAKQVREHLVGARAWPKTAVKAAGYWKRGAAATHDTHED